MPKAAIFFSILCLFLTNSYAFTGDDVLQDESQKLNYSQIIDVDSNFFIENN